MTVMILVGLQVDGLTCIGHPIVRLIVFPRVFSHFGWILGAEAHRFLVKIGITLAQHMFQLFHLLGCGTHSFTRANPEPIHLELKLLVFVLENLAEVVIWFRQ